MVVGTAAKSDHTINQKNVIFNAKRLIGRKFEDPNVQGLILNCPYQVELVDETPCFKVETGGGKFKHLAPQVVSAKILKKLKTTAEDYLHESVDSAVITVPAYFTDGQRLATKEAAEIAGFRVLQLQNEPTAAALAYHWQQPCDRPQTLLVFDLGGGTFDVCIITVKGGEILVKAVEGDGYLGGEDFDLNLVNYCIQEFENAYTLKVQNNPTNELQSKQYRRSWGRLKNAVEDGKKTLSSTTQVTLALDGWYGGHDLHVELTRAKFEELNDALFSKAMLVVDRTMKAANIGEDEIDHVVLVGGSSRIPKIRELLGKKFGQLKLRERINADEAVAYGAAIHAAMLNGLNEQRVKGISLSNVVPASIGIGLSSGQFNKLAVKNMITPFTVEQSYCCPDGGKMKIRIYEGEHNDVSQNHKLGVFELQGQQKSGDMQIVFHMDRDGILTVSGKYPEGMGHGGNEVKVIDYRKRLTEAQIEAIKKEAVEENN